MLGQRKDLSRVEQSSWPWAQRFRKEPIGSCGEPPCTVAHRTTTLAVTSSNCWFQRFLPVVVLEFFWKRLHRRIAWLLGNRKYGVGGRLRKQACVGLIVNLILLEDSRNSSITLYCCSWRCPQSNRRGTTFRDTTKVARARSICHLES